MTMSAAMWPTHERALLALRFHSNGTYISHAARNPNEKTGWACLTSMWHV